MDIYFRDKDGKDTFPILEAKELSENLNALNEQFGFHYRVERFNLTTAKIIKIKNEGGIVSTAISKKCFKKKGKRKC